MMRLKELGESAHKRLKVLGLELKDRFGRYSDREKKMLIIGGSAPILFLCYALMWSPILSHLSSMREKVESNQKLVSWMQGADRAIAELQKSERKRAKPESLVAFLSIIKQGIQQASLSKSLAQLRQAGADTIEIQFQQVNFDQAISYLSSLLLSHDVHVQQFSVTALPTPGLTNIVVLLRVTTSAA